MTSDPTAAVTTALIRVLGGDPGSGAGSGAGSGDRTGIRSDTVLADLGVDRLARVLIVDACLAAGVRLDPQAAWTAATVDDLVQSTEGFAPVTA